MIGDYIVVAFVLVIGLSFPALLITFGCVRRSGRNRMRLMAVARANEL